MVLLDLLIPQEQARLIGCRCDNVFALALHLGEQLLDKIEILIGKMTGNRNNCILRTVIFAHILVQCF